MKEMNVMVNEPFIRCMNMGRGLEWQRIILLAQKSPAEKYCVLVAMAMAMSSFLYRGLFVFSYSFGLWIFRLKRDGNDMCGVVILEETYQLVNEMLHELAFDAVFFLS